MRRLSRDPLRFDVIHAFANFGQNEKVSLRGAGVADGFVNRMRDSISGSLGNDRLLQGLRTQSMFESLVASLGAVEILKQEDEGEIYVSDDTMRVPDFRVVLADSAQMLVEVKNFYPTDARKPFELDADYLDGLVRYARAMNSNLQLAIYWARWNIWTLVPPEVFGAMDGKRRVELAEAMRANHMASLGDYSIGTRFPLSIVMYADKKKPRAVEENGTASFTVGSVEVCCAGQRIEDPLEKQIAVYLMMYGKWNYEAVPRIANGSVDSVEHHWMPMDDNEQGFEMVDSLSGMFSRFYTFATADEDKIARLRLDISPGSWGALIPKDYHGKVLSLWRFILEPSLKGESE